MYFADVITASLILLIISLHFFPVDFVNFAAYFLDSIDFTCHFTQLIHKFHRLFNKFRADSTDFIAISLISDYAAHVPVFSLISLISRDISPIFLDISQISLIISRISQEYFRISRSCNYL